MTILNNLKLVNERINKSCAMSNINLSKVKILAVSKKMGTNKIFEAPTSIDFHIREWNENNHIDIANKILKNV